jgi:ABC-2 type transport system permease protein
VKKVLAIAGVALKRFVRDRGNLFFVFILPIGIIILIGAQFGGGFAPQMGIHVPADGGAMADAIVQNLEDAGEVDIVRYDSRSALVDAVALGDIEVGVDLPDNLGQRLLDGEDLTIDMVGPEGQILGGYQALLNDAIAEITETETAIRFAIAQGATRADATAAATRVADAVPTITVATSEVGESLFAGITGQFEIGATSQLILFMFLTGLTGSSALIQSRRYGVTRRMLSTPTGALTVVSGEALGRFAVVLVQGLYIILATIIMFQVEWGNILGAAAIVIAFGACGAGAAMLFGTLFRNDQQATGVGVIVGLGLAALGGCMVPIELFPPAMETVAKFTPHAWALEAFAEIQRHGGTVVDILPQLGVIAGFAAVLIGLATWRMRVTLGRAEVSA